MYVYQIIYSIVAIVVPWFVKKFISDRAIDKVAAKLRLEEYAAKPIKKMFTVIIYIIAFFFLLGIWGMRGTLTGLLAGAGFAGIVIGLAVRGVVSDLLSGVIIFFDCPFKIGDALVVGDVGGQVLDIGMRSVKIRSWDGVYVTIPNSKICSEVLKNYTHYNRRRLEINVGVDYETDLEIARKAISKALQREDLPILKDPEPLVFLDKLAGSSIDFKILFWFQYDIPMSFFNLKGRLIQAIVEEFRKQKITIPFPQVTISSREEAELAISTGQNDR
ncbi:MAG: mechanosensitive ion channel family protein [Candidatus Aerophobetes bacterium]|nr:mechanosensitive ion channel family protein [Candidatus Aerophobetes bacterium]